jgi:hypothetical protein
VTALGEEHRRALRTLARSPSGCTQALMMAHGFPIELLDALVTTGLAKLWSEEMPRGRWKRMKVSWMQITAEGREELR